MMKIILEQAIPRFTNVQNAVEELALIVLKGLKLNFKAFEVKKIKSKRDFNFDKNEKIQ